MTADTIDTTAVVVSSPLDLIESLDDSLIITALQGATDAAVRTWAYQFRQDGQDIIGMSIDGVQEAAREMARRGDVIDQTEVKLDRETDREAYFTARAVRYAVSPDGQRVQMDSAIRSKRIEKFTRLREPKTINGKVVTEVFNRYWYEVGVAKAARNAVEALLPEGIKQWMMETAKKGGNVRDVSKEKRQAAQHHTAPGDGARTQGAPKAGAGGKQRVLTEINRAKQSIDAESFAKIGASIRERWPNAMSEAGAVTLSNVDDATANAIADYVAKQIDGEGPGEPVQAAMV